MIDIESVLGRLHPDPCFSAGGRCNEIVVVFFARQHNNPSGMIEICPHMFNKTKPGMIENCPPMFNETEKGMIEHCPHAFDNKEGSDRNLSPYSE